jgi:hypothetical protein
LNLLYMGNAIKMTQLCLHLFMKSMVCSVATLL